MRRPLFSLDVYRARRERLAKRHRHALFVIPAARETIRNDDVAHVFRQNSAFAYLAGFPEPDAVLVIETRDGECDTTLFCAPRNEATELWTGEIIGPERAERAFGTRALSLDFLETSLIAIAGRTHEHFYPCVRDPYWELPGGKALVHARSARAARKYGHAAIAALRDADHAIGELRLIKDAPEITIMERSAKVTADAHRSLLAFARPGMHEYELEAHLTARFRAAGGHPSHAYPPIVASGTNACTLHYTENDREIRHGELVLVDAGSEIGGYAADVTRTFPIDGIWSPEQRAIYTVVLSAQRAAIDAARPGATFSLMHDRAALAIAEGLVRLKLLSGEPEALVRSGAYRDFFMHRTGHWLGLDVHDAGDYHTLGSEDCRTLEPGMVCTVEPGIYLSGKSAPKRYRGIGVRIEDDVLVTDGAPRVLTDAAPKDPNEISAIMRERRA